MASNERPVTGHGAEYDRLINTRRPLTQPELRRLVELADARPKTGGCRYYGKSSLILKRTGELVVFPPEMPTNECAVVFPDRAPCEMQRCGAVPDESYCPRAERYRAGKPVTL